MLPFITRNRKPGSASSSDDVSELMSTMKRTSQRFSRVPLKTKCVFILLLTLAFLIYGGIFWVWKDNRLTREDFLGTDKCPSCYGRSLCFELFDNQLDLKGISKMRAFDFVNLRNVHFAYHKERELNVVLKRLAHDSEIEEIDDTICADSFRKPGCDLARTSVLTKTSQDIVKNGLLPKYFKDTSFMFTCPSHKFLSRVVEKYQEKTTHPVEMEQDDKLQLLYTAKVNPEPLLLQVL